MAECMMKLQAPAEALPWFERLVAEFQESEYLDRAALRIKEIKGGVQD
jgi:hypothetical protein